GIFFRIQIENNFKIVFGDRTDGLIQITHLEHWHNVFRGLSPWMRTFYFYPARDTLGYNDGYFLYGCIYSIWRTFSFDPFIASDLTNATLKTIGFFSFFLCARIVFSCPVIVCALFSAVFTIANSTYANAYHAQLFSISFAPLALLIAFLFAKNSLLNNFRSYVWGIILALLLDSWLLTAFYTIWFFVYNIAICTITALLILPKEIWKAILIWIYKSKTPLTISIAILIIGVIPFWHVYHFTARATGMHPFKEVQQYLPSMLGIINVGPSNLFYGSLITNFSPYLGDRLPMSGEQIMGIPLFLLFLAIALLFIAIFSKKKLHPTIRVAVIGTFISWILTTGLHGYPVWQLFYFYFPGAKAVRVISRYELFLSFPFTIFAMLIFSRVLSVKDKSLSPVRIIVIVALGAFLIGEEVNVSWPLGLSPSVEIARIDKIGSPPKDCSSFYTVKSRNNELLLSPGIDSTYGNNVDSMFIAEMTDVPTLNGMDSFTPPGWNLTGYRNSDYLDKVNTYIAENHLKNVCILNLQTMRWNLSQHFNR
ncbi:hypothetical protein, partial [Kozakia baliensis]